MFAVRNDGLTAMWGLVLACVAAMLTGITAFAQDQPPLPDGVEKRSVTIWSDGTRMAGDLYLPRDRKPNEKLPGVVFCAGTGGTKKGTGRRLGVKFASRGYVALAFDYRGWGESDSQLIAAEPQPHSAESTEVTMKVRLLRWQMNLDDQIRDIRCAIAFLEGQPEADAERIGLFGSSYGGGLVTLMAAIDPRVKCVAAQVAGLGTGPQRDKVGYQLLGKQARGETEPVPVDTGRLGGPMARYESMRSNPAKSIGYPNKYELVDRIRVPMIFIDAEKEELSNPKENGEKFAGILRKNGVPVKYHVIKGISHYGIYREGFDEATTLELAWFDEYLKGTTEKAVGASADSTDAPTGADTQAPRPIAERAAMPNPTNGFAALDSDGDGRLSPKEFGALQTSAAYFREHPEAVQPVFKRLDADADGSLTVEEYRNIGRPRSGNTGQGVAKPLPPEMKAAAASAEPAAASVSAIADADIAFFEKNIRPVLIKNCYECHSADAQDVKGGLVLDARAALLRGGDSGPAVVPGKPDESLLITSLRHTNPDLKMPPDKHGGKLSDAVIGSFVQWVKRGAAMPEGDAADVARRLEPRMDHWAFKPVTAPVVPEVKTTSWPKSEVDRFILTELEANGLEPVGDAEPAALFRRVHLDLTGMPPTAEKVQAFLSDPSATRIDTVIDELLDSPRYGEHWGRHWLDVARYAESSGKETDFAYPQAWRYRDYVIQAFNQDMPFDQFIREQIAGDLYDARDDRMRAELLIATGFLAIGPKSHIEKNPLQFELDVVDEQIDTVSVAFLGLTVACARCHDHKYDPISQRDYYALAGIFRSTDTRYGTVEMVQNNNPGDLEALPSTAGQADALKVLTARDRTALEAAISRKSERLAEMAKKREYATLEFVQTRLRLATDKARLDAYHADGTPKQFATCVLERDTPRNSELFIRGEAKKPGDVVPRGLPAFAKRGGPIAYGSGRKELASWISSPENPLTARVIVNRVWLHLFGQGLVPTPDNVGLSGQAPTHPALLDHLAARFVKEGWSVKSLVRELMTSRAYALSTAHNTKNFQVDPDNHLLWRMTPRRLDAESIRDAMLLTAGMLDLRPPTGSTVGAFGEGYAVGAQTRLSDQVDLHRSVYLPVVRNMPLESLALFDGAPGSVVTGQRPQTTVPAQSLYLLNSPLVTKMAERAAQRLLVDRPTSEPHRVTLAYERVFNRSPTETEIRAALDFIKTQPDVSTGWAAFCQSLWASQEFLARN